jgi:predicted dehydrogenase
MTMSYRVGVVGARRGSSLIRPFALFPETQIVAMCDVDERRLADAAASLDIGDENLFTSYDEFLDANIDIVVVGTPIQFHAEQSVQAMEAGKHVLSEVTAAYTLEDCQRLVDTVQRTGRTYMMAENCCYYHFIRQWKAWIGSGRLGDIFYAEAEYIHNVQHLMLDRESGESYWRLYRPPIYYCTHSLGPLLYLMEDRIVRTTCLDAGYGILPNLGPGCLNMEVALFQTQKGAVIKLLRSQVAYREPPMHFYSLYGTKGSLENDRAGHGGGHQVGKGKLYVAGEHERTHEVIDCPEADPDAPPEAYAGGHGTTEYYLVRDFIHAVQQGTRPPIDAVTAAEWTAPGICAHESARLEGKWIDVPQFRV